MAIIVDEPIINSPFAEPTRHYRSRNGQADLRENRRPSGYTPGLRTRGGQTSVLEDDYVELPIVNEIRVHVARWREAGYSTCTGKGGGRPEGRPRDACPPTAEEDQAGIGWRS